MPMPVIYLLTAGLILLYLLYPVWLMLLKRLDFPDLPQQGKGINAVSVILLTYNGSAHIRQKVNFLRKELALFDQAELIIIDDCSTDNTSVLLQEWADLPGVRVVMKSRHGGIPDSMNLGVRLATHEFIIFCDQRQHLSENFAGKLLKPLLHDHVGAVSACIANRDRQQHFSLLRWHENYLKLLENRAGALIGVYGPCYAIKKQVFTPIPEDIILDDLFLSLHILKDHSIVFEPECEILEDHATGLFDYHRARRYLRGLLQLLFRRNLFTELGTRTCSMVLWHKYLRLLLPLLFAMSYGALALQAINSTPASCLFFGISLLIFVSLLPQTARYEFRFKNIVRMNVLYFFSWIDVILHGQGWPARMTVNSSAVKNPETKI